MACYAGITGRCNTQDVEANKRKDSDIKETKGWLTNFVYPYRRPGTNSPEKKPSAVPHVAMTPVRRLHSLITFIISNALDYSQLKTNSTAPGALPEKEDKNNKSLTLYMISN